MTQLLERSYASEHCCSGLTEPAYFSDSLQPFVNAWTQDEPHDDQDLLAIQPNGASSRGTRFEDDASASSDDEGRAKVNRISSVLNSSSCKPRLEASCTKGTLNSEHAQREAAEYVSTQAAEQVHRQIQKTMMFPNAKSCLTVYQERVDIIMRHTVTEMLISALIIISSMVVGLEVDWTVSNPNGSTPFGFQLTGYIINSCFLLEVTCRIFGSGPTDFASGKDRLWNLFDSLLVLSSIIELFLELFVDKKTGSVSSMRVVRLVRIGRILRIIRVARIVKLLIALRLLMVQIIGTLRAAFWALVLLVMILYVFGMIFAQICSEHIANTEPDPQIIKYWGTVPRSMYTLYKCVTGGLDWEWVAEDLSKVHWFWVVVFNIYLSFVVFAVLNVVVGVFCQSAIESAAHDYENIINVKIREKANFKRKVKQLFEDIDSSGDGCITFFELEKELDKDNIRAYFEYLGISPGDAWDLFKILDEDESSFIELDEFISGCLRLKGHAKVIDIEKLQYDNRHMRKKLMEFFKQTQDILILITTALKIKDVGTTSQHCQSKKDSRMNKALVSLAEKASQPECDTEKLILKKHASSP